MEFGTNHRCFDSAKFIDEDYGTVNAPSLNLANNLGCAVQSLTEVIQTRYTSDLIQYPQYSGEEISLG